MVEVSSTKNLVVHMTLQKIVLRTFFFANISTKLESGVSSHVVSCLVVSTLPDCLKAKCPRNIVHKMLNSLPNNFYLKLYTRNIKHMPLHNL